MKHNIVPVHAMKACGGTGGIAPLILNLGARQSYVSPLPAASRRGKNACAHRIRGFCVRNSNLSHLVIITFINYSALLGA
jgi:hypothetical protein